MIHKIVIVLSVAFIFSSCAELFLQPYGQVTPDAGNAHVGSILLPEGAPTISQGYNPWPSDDSGATPGAGHEGIDIYARTGTPVIAPASGLIINSSFEPFYGNHIVIDHGRDENGEIIRSTLLHLDTRLVEKGEVVIRGEKIGTLGSTGLLASYTHLHFEIRVGPRSESRNPHKYWVDGPAIVTCFDKSKEYPDIPFRTTYPLVCR